MTALALGRHGAQHGSHVDVAQDHFIDVDDQQPIGGQGGIGVGIDDPLPILDRRGPTAARDPEGGVADDQIVGA